MKRNWLFLRPFDESADTPFDQLHIAAQMLTLLLTTVLPISVCIGVFKLSRGDEAVSAQWFALGIAVSAIITLYQAVLSRRGHAANQLILTALLFGLMLL
jgi:hypothetical protein